MISGSLGNSRSSSRARRIASSHSWHTDVGFPAARRVALVEQQVDHGCDSGEAFGPLRRTRRLEGHVGRSDAALCSGDALLHGALAHQEGARDLLDRQAGHDAQRQRDLLGRRQLAMAADEQEAQHVVAVVRAVEPLGQLGFRVIEIRQDLLRRQRLVPARAAPLIERKVAPDQDEPGGGIARRASLRPGLEGAQARFLERLLGDIEVAEVAQQRAEGLGPGRRQRRMDPGDVGHAGEAPGVEGGDGTDFVGAGSMRRCSARAGGRRRWRLRARRSRLCRSRAAAPWSRQTDRR